MDKTIKYKEIDQPKVSVLVPIYNVAPFIERCVESLFRQTFESIQFIFVNDSTPDNSMDILHHVLEKYPNRQEQVLIINHEENNGIGVTRNTLLDASTAEYYG